MIHVSTERVATPRTATDRRTRQLAKEQSYPQNQKSLVRDLWSCVFISVQSTGPKGGPRLLFSVLLLPLTFYLLVVRLSGYALASERQKPLCALTDAANARPRGRGEREAGSADCGVQCTGCLLSTTILQYSLGTAPLCTHAHSSACYTQKPARSHCT